jgi:hypothetical protein
MTRTTRFKTTPPTPKSISILTQVCETRRVKVARSAERAFFAGVFFSKDRREEVIEVEEELETEYISAVGERVKLMNQNQWMKGCPEGGEQGFLFSLYSQLIEGNCLCPSGCGYSIPRAKHHFFAIFVRILFVLVTERPHHPSNSRLSTYISST